MGKTKRDLGVKVMNWVYIEFAVRTLGGDEVRGPGWRSEFLNQWCMNAGRPVTLTEIAQGMAVRENASGLSPE